jgi:NADH-quinone oxidoreductase subunit M
MDAVKITILIPFLGVLVSVFLRSIWVGVIFSFLTFISSLFIETGYQGEINLAEKLGLTLSLQVDGLNILLIWLTTGLTFLVFLYGIVEKRERKDEYTFLFLLLEALLLPAFKTKNLLAFYFFFDAILIPMFFIIGIWGTGNKVYAAYKFVLFTFFGSIFFLVSVVFLAKEFYATQGKISFELEDLISVSQNLSGSAKILLFLGFFVAFAVKMPLVPVHVWLPDAHTEAPTGGSVILAGILLKLGSYAFLRFAVPIFPDIIKEYWFLISLIGVLGIVFGAILALSQEDMKRLIAYSSVSHMGYVMLGSVAMAQGKITYEGLQGAILQMINHAIATGGLFFVVGMIYERTHTRMIKDYSGIAKKVPFLTFFFFTFALSSIGFPSTGGFVGELLVIIGAIKASKIIGIITAAGAILSAGYMLYLALRVFFGPEKHSEKLKHIEDINKVEFFVLLCLAIFVFAIGIYPKPFMEIIRGGIDFVWSKLQIQ